MNILLCALSSPWRPKGGFVTRGGIAGRCTINVAAESNWFGYLLRDEPCAGLTLPGAAALAALTTCVEGAQGAGTKPMVAWPCKEPKSLGDKAGEGCHAGLRFSFMF